MTPAHLPAMVSETLSFLDPQPGKTILDLTLGSGGHARQMLSRGARVIGLDRDAEALQRAQEALRGFEDRLTLLHARMSEAAEALSREGISQIDGALLDAGISMDQMLDEGRSFSVHSRSGLDMRMDRSDPEALTAYDVVNRYLEKDLARLFAVIGKGGEARRVARRIVEARGREPIRSTAALAELIAATVVRERPARAIDAAPFLMAIRIEVNNELGELQEGIEAAISSLSHTGKLVTLTWNSAEHHVCRQTLRHLANPCTCPPTLPCACGKKPVVQLLTRKSLYPAREEVEANAAARSVRLTAAMKL